MQRDRLKRLYHLHTVVGIALGWLLFVVCFSGSVAMFYDEMVEWEDPALRGEVPGSPVPANPLLDEFVAQQSGEINSLFLMLPHHGRPYYELFANIETESGNERVEQRFRADTGEVIGPKADGPALWLLRFHQNLQVERQIGRSVVGIVGVFMLLSLLTGIITHRKILKDLYKVRWHRSLHLKWKDLHTGLGIWTIPFSAMIAFTGAILGLVVLFLPLLALTAFKGDQERAIEAVIGAPPEPAGIEAPMVPLEDVLARINAETPYRGVRVSLEHYGDANAKYKVFAETDKELVRFVQVDANAVSGELEPVEVVGGSLGDSAAARVLAAITPLHYGTYGGLLLKVIYYLLGLALSISIVMGTCIYLERRLEGPIGHRSPRFYRVVGRLNSGVACGLALASVIVFYSDRLWGMHGEDRSYATGLVFLVVWLAAIAWSLWIYDMRRSARQILAATTALCLALPLLDIATAPQAVQTAAALTVNLVILGSGVLLGAYLRLSRNSARTVTAATVTEASLTTT